MGDYTPLVVTVYDYPRITRSLGEFGEVSSDEVATAILEVIDGYGLGSGWGARRDPDEGLVLGQDYVDDEARVGTGIEIAVALEKLGATFLLQENAYSPYLGDLIVFTPELGRYHAACSEEGHALFTEREVREMITLPPEELERRFGTPWFEAIRAFDSAEEAAPVA